MSPLVDARHIRPHVAALSVLLNELFRSALDYGVLKLDPQLKRRPESYEQFLLERKRRAQRIDSGWIALNFEDNAHKYMSIA